MTEDVLRRKADRLREFLLKIERLAAREDFESEDAVHDLCAYYLILAVEQCCDLAEHIISEQGWGVPESAGDEFDLLAGHGVIEADLAGQMRQAAGLRNLLVHQYASADWSRVKVAARDPARLLSFLAAVLKFGGVSID